MKVISIVVKDGLIANEIDLITSVVTHDDFSALVVELRKAYKRGYMEKSEYHRICKKVSAVTGFSRTRFDFSPYSERIKELVASGYTVKAILTTIGEEDAHFKKLVNISALTHYISTHFKDEKTKARAIAKSSKDFLYAYRFDLKKFYFKGLNVKEITKIMKHKYPNDFAKITEAQIGEFLKNNAQLDATRKISLIKKPSLYDEHFDEIMRLYKSGMRVYDIWKTLKSKYPALAKLQAPSLYHFIGNNALGKAKYMQEG